MEELNMPDTNPGGTPMPGFPPVPIDCNSIECTSAKADVVNAGNIIKLKCGQVDSAKGKRDVFAAMAAVFATLALAALGAAGAASASFFGIPAAIVLFWVAVILALISALFWLLAGIFEIQVLVVEGEL